MNSETLFQWCLMLGHVLSVALTQHCVKFRLRLNMKGCIFQFTKCQIHPFISIDSLTEWLLKYKKAPIHHHYITDKCITNKKVNTRCQPEKEIIYLLDTHVSYLAYTELN